MLFIFSLWPITALAASFQSPFINFNPSSSSGFTPAANQFHNEARWSADPLQPLNLQTEAGRLADYLFLNLNLIKATYQPGVWVFEVPREFKRSGPITVDKYQLTFSQSTMLYENNG